MTATPDTPGGSVDLPAELRSEIREFAQAIPDMDYYQVLGVARDDDTSAIRDAFFERSKRFHPDRYFNKELGVYGDLLHEIYKRIVVANDMLRDPALKARYDKALAPESASASSQLSPAPSSAPASRTPPPAAEPRRSPGRSLRDRSGLRERRDPLAGLRRKLESGQKKARALYDEACELRDGQEFERAASCARSAAAYDPRNKEYADLLGELLPRINGARVLEVRRRGRQLLQRGQVISPHDRLNPDHHQLLPLSDEQLVEGVDTVLGDFLAGVRGPHLLGRAVDELSALPKRPHHRSLRGPL